MSRTWNAQLFDGITPLLITFNEAPNIARTLDKLGWARRIVVVDSGSSDGTLEILARYPQVALFTRAFDNFADQCNFGLAQVQTEWVLSLDADYELSQELVDELRALKPHEHTTGYRARFIYRIYGRPCAERFTRYASYSIEQAALNTKTMVMDIAFRSTAVSTRLMRQTIMMIASRLRAGFSHSSDTRGGRPNIC